MARKIKLTPFIRNRLKTKMSGRWTEYGLSAGTKRSKHCKTESERCKLMARSRYWNPVDNPLEAFQSSTGIHAAFHSF